MDIFENETRRKISLGVYEFTIKLARSMVGRLRRQRCVSDVLCGTVYASSERDPVDSYALFGNRHCLGRVRGESRRCTLVSTQSCEARLAFADITSTIYFTSRSGSISITRFSI